MKDNTIRAEIVFQLKNFTSAAFVFVSNPNLFATRANLLIQADDFSAQADHQTAAGDA